MPGGGDVASCTFAQTPISRQVIQVCVCGGVLLLVQAHAHTNTHRLDIKTNQMKQSVEKQSAESPIHRKLHTQACCMVPGNGGGGGKAGLLMWYVSTEYPAQEWVWDSAQVIAMGLQVSLHCRLSRSAQLKFAHLGQFI